MDINEITDRVIGAAIAVHRELGPGLLESSYDACLAVEFGNRGLRYQREYPLKLDYRGATVDCAYRLDYLVEGKVVLELKSIAGFEPVHEAQMLTYLKLSGCTVGLLINFNVRLLKTGIRRFINSTSWPSPAVR